jgi:hypothetical protein
MEHSPDVIRLIDEQVARVRSRWPETRFAIRSGRIAIALLIALGAYWLGSSGSEALDKPLAALTLRDLAALIFYMVLAFVLTGFAFYVAFGKGPPAPQVNDCGLRRQAESTVLRRLARRSFDAAQMEAERRRAAHWYRHGKVIGILFDPTIQRRHWWAPFAAIVGTTLASIGVMFAVAYVYRYMVGM